MRNKKGFTLVELLIAATIVGILTVFATVQYRNSRDEVRIAGGKARVDMLAGAVQRWRLEHGSSYIVGEMTDINGTVDGSTCNYAPSSADPTQLIKCGYVENGGWETSQEMPLIFYVCGTNTTTGNCAGAPISSPLACMISGGGFHSDKFGDGYMYCASKTDKGEKLAQPE